MGSIRPALRLFHHSPPRNHLGFSRDSAQHTRSPKRHNPPYWVGWLPPRLPPSHGHQCRNSNNKAWGNWWCSCRASGLRAMQRRRRETKRSRYNRWSGNRVRRRLTWPRLNRSRKAVKRANTGRSTERGSERTKSLSWTSQQSQERCRIIEKSCFSGVSAQTYRSCRISPTNHRRGG